MKNGKYVLVFVIVLVLRYLQTYGSYSFSLFKNNPNGDFAAIDHNAKVAAIVNAIGAAIIVSVLYWLFDNVLFMRNTDEREESIDEEIILDETAKEDEDHSKWIPNKNTDGS